MIAILIVILLIVIGVLAVFLNKKSQHSDSKNPIVGNEQEDEDKQQSGDGLQIQEDNEKIEEDSSDASGSWEDDATGEISGEASVNEGTSDGQDDNQGGNAGQEGIENETGPGEDKDEEEKDDEDTLIDDKVWGDIF